MGGTKRKKRHFESTRGSRGKDSYLPKKGYPLAGGKFFFLCHYHREGVEYSFVAKGTSPCSGGVVRRVTENRRKEGVEFQRLSIRTGKREKSFCLLREKSSILKKKWIPKQGSLNHKIEKESGEKRQPVGKKKRFRLNFPGKSFHLLLLIFIREEGGKSAHKERVDNLVGSLI